MNGKLRFGLAEITSLLMQLLLLFLFESEPFYLAIAKIQLE